MRKIYAVLFFTATTLAGTAQISMIKHLEMYSYFGIVNDKMLFFANNGIDEYDYELWSSDGTDVGTHLVKDVDPGTDGGILQESQWATSFNQYKPIVYNDELYFLADDGLSGILLFKSDGTEPGTQKVHSSSGDLLVYSSPSHYFPYFCEMGGILYFSANDGEHGYELWRTDGTDAGTYMVKDISSDGDYGSLPSHLYAWNGAVYFSASDDVDGVELFKSDGTEGGTGVLKNIFPGIDGAFDDGYFESIDGHFTGSGDYLYFTAGTSPASYIPGLYRTDGTEAGTIKLDEGLYNITDLTDVDGTLFYDADKEPAGDPSRLYKSNGTAAGTVNVAMNDGNFATSSFYGFNHALFFYGDNLDDYSLHGLFKSDGTTGGTSLIYAMEGGASNPSIQDYIEDPATNTFFFRAQLKITDSFLGWRIGESNGNSTQVYYGGSPYFGFGNTTEGLIMYHDVLYFLGYDTTFTNASEGLYKLAPLALDVADHPIAVQFAVRPDPASSTLYISVPSAMQNNELTLQLFDITGKITVDEKIKAVNNEILLDVHAIPEGIYVAKMAGGRYSGSERVCVVH